MPKPVVVPADAKVGGGSNPPATEHPWVHHGVTHSRVVDYDPLFNRTTTYWYDDHERKQWLVETWHDLTPILEANKAQYNATDERARMAPLRDGGEVTWTKVATVPMAIVPDLLKRTHNGKDRKAVSRWLMDPDNRVFQTRPLKLGV